VFVPLIHWPGEAQVDFGEALVKMNGRLRKVAFLVMALPYSGCRSREPVGGFNSVKSCPVRVKGGGGGG
jgi:hypothetical protein